MEAIVNQLSDALKQGIKREYKERRSVLSFFEYLEEVSLKPERHFRNAAQYFSAVIDHYGSYKIKEPTGKSTRYKVFDSPFDDGQSRVMGQESVQQDLVRLIKNFVKSGKIDRLIMLHGPNGSAKTSLIQALALGAEAYSQLDEGAIYHFSWVFPTKEANGKTLGFQKISGETAESYAYLENEQVATTIPCDMKDHPLLLLSKSYRELMFKDLVERGALDRNYVIPEILKSGDLSAKNRKVYDALLSTYHGNALEVLKHVQVKRFYFSRRYRQGIASVEPQMSVDAHARQIMMDQSLAALPATLQHLNLFQCGGALSEANRGLIEYSDLLKRPIESWKYLLVATEQAHVNVDVMLMFLDVLMIASSNELHLASFREYPDWQSFKGRFELVKVPYLRRFSDEVKIYENQIPRILVGTHIAPHALEIAARWAVLTRLEPPRSDVYPQDVRDVVKSITPIEKLELYDTGIAPERLSQKEAKNLRKRIDSLYREYVDDVDYEGRYGASPREIRMLLLNASQRREYDHLSPIGVLKELRSLVRERSSYDFLRRESLRGYRDALKFVDEVEKYFIRQLDDEIRSAMGLVSAESHLKLFELYIRHVSAWTKKEKIRDLHRDVMVEPDSKLMNEVESVLVAKTESSEDFRRSIIAQIGAFRLENPEQSVDYTLLFGNYMRRLKDDYYERQKLIVDKILDVYLKLEDEENFPIKTLDPKVVEQAKILKDNLKPLGYTSSSAHQAIAYLLKAKNL